MVESPKQSGDQIWSSQGYERHARFVSDLGGGVVDWLAAKPGERILDLGCGDGALTQKLHEAGVDVVGVDSSDIFVTAARERGLDVRLMDGHSLEFDAEFDAVFSNAALHWMTRPREVVAGVARTLRPGGRFVAEFGGHGNVAAILTAIMAVGEMRKGDKALAHCWYFPTTGAYKTLLSETGFSVSRIELIPRPTPLPTDMAGWLMTFRAPFFEQFGADCDAALADVVALLRPSLCDENGAWTADYVRLRVEAVAV